MSAIDVWVDLYEVAADTPSALNGRYYSDDGEKFSGWLPIDAAIGREGLAVALTAVSAGKRVRVRIVDLESHETRRLTAVRFVL